MVSLFICLSDDLLPTTAPHPPSGLTTTFGQRSERCPPKCSPLRTLTSRIIALRFGNKQRGLAVVAVALCMPPSPGMLWPYRADFRLVLYSPMGWAWHGKTGRVFCFGVGWRSESRGCVGGWLVDQPGSRKNGRVG